MDWRTLMTKIEVLPADSPERDVLERLMQSSAEDITKRLRSKGYIVTYVQASVHYYRPDNSPIIWAVDVFNIPKCHNWSAFRRKLHSVGLHMVGIDWVKGRGRIVALMDLREYLAYYGKYACFDNPGAEWISSDIMSSTQAM